MLMEFEKIAEIIAEKMDIDVTEIKPESTFESLSIDSLDMVEIVMDIESEFDIAIESGDGLSTVADLVDYIVNAK